MGAFRILRRSFATGIAFTLTAHSQGVQQEPCKRPPARTTVPGETIVVSDPARIPCRIRFADIGVRLSAKPASKVEEIGVIVGRGPDGKYYTSMDHTGTIAVWDSKGNLLRTHGRSGAGPGEFALGPKFFKFDVDGRILIGDNNKRYSVFTDDFKFVRTYPASDIGIGLYNCCVILDDRSLLTSYGKSTGSFRIIDVRSNNAIAPTSLAFGPAVTVPGLTRPIAYASGRSFWAGPPTKLSFEYVLEQWTTDGKLLRTLRRKPKWLEASAAPSSADRMPAAEMQMFHDDGTGLLFVSVMMPTTSFGRLTPAQLKDRSPNSPFDRAIQNWVEVIDVNAGVVLATLGPLTPSALAENVPPILFPKSRDGYIRGEDKDGFASVRIVQALLSAR